MRKRHPEITIKINVAKPINVASKDMQARLGRLVARSATVAIACKGVRKSKMKIDGNTINKATALNQTGSSMFDLSKTNREIVHPEIDAVTARLVHAFTQFRFLCGTGGSNSIEDGGAANGFSFTD